MAASSTADGEKDKATIAHQLVEVGTKVRSKLDEANTFNSLDIAVAAARADDSSGTQRERAQANLGQRATSITPQSGKEFLAWLDRRTARPQTRAVPGKNLWMADLRRRG